ncbi:MAG: TauD/TfdA family dioxygenase [Candidatus Rokuibacteriota bacterium]
MAPPPPAPLSQRPSDPIPGPAAWHGRELSGSTAWIRQIPAAALDELHAALGLVRRRRLAWRDISRDDFPLPEFSGTLADVSRELEEGRGVVLLRGLPVDRYAEDELRQIFWGIGAHLGVARHQNAHGELLGEVRDEARLYGAVRQPAAPRGEPGRPPTSRARARSSGPLRFHTDRTDVVGLFCVRKARSGGISKVVSSVAVHNAILERRPDLHALLCQDYYRSREGEEVAGERRHYALPVFAVRDGHFTSQYSRTFVEAAQRISEVPRMSAAQDEALDLLAEVAEELCLWMTFEPGDIQLLNNHVIYHARTAYEDDEAADSDRLLLRLWLSVPNSRPLPPGFEGLWGSIEAGALRGGIAQAPSS